MSGSGSGGQGASGQVTEVRVAWFGEQILQAARGLRTKQSAADRWLEGFLQRSMENEAFRVQALRFIDALPALTNDADLVRHFNEYFSGQDLPLPGSLKWGISRVARGIAPAILGPAIRSAGRILARRFLGGSDIRELKDGLQHLRRQGLSVSLDRLGEAVVSEPEAGRYLQAYLDVLEGFPEETAEGAGPRHVDPEVPNLSLKVSSLYSRISPRDPEGSAMGILARLRPLVRMARDRGASVCLDMEQYDIKQVTLAVFRELITDPEFLGWDGLGIALQAYLRDTEQDLEEILGWADGRSAPVTLRLVRGAYWDQEVVLAQREGWPIPVWTRKADTDRLFERCLVRLFEHHESVRTAVATHNVRSLALAMALAEQYAGARQRFEFQMLYGMGESLHTAVAELGYRTRIYVPFGALLPGMAYLVRRLLENSCSQSFLSMGRIPDGDAAALLAPPAPAATGEPEAVPGGPVFLNEPRRRFTDAGERQAFSAALSRVAGQLGEDYPLIIGGVEQALETGIVSLNPSRPDEHIGRVSAAGAEQAEAAVKAARSAFHGWRDTTPSQRAALLQAAAGLLRDQRDEFAAWEIFEAGKNWPEADADVTEAIDFLEYYAAEARRLADGTAMDVPGETNRYLYRPRGVGVILPPWNYPLAILTGMLSAAVVTGNTAILKPSSQTPVIAARFVRLLREAGLPDGVVNFLPGSGSEVGEYLVRHPGVDFIAFTGSQEVGTRINRLASEIRPGQHHIKRVIAEMGGKNAIIVDAGADLDDAVTGTLASAYGYQGQKCSACSRVIVLASAHEAFVPRLLEAVASLRIGAPKEPGVDMGPVIEAAAKARIGRAIAQGKKVARLAMEADVSTLGAGFFVGPAVFTDVPPDSALAQEEIFGPVLAVIKARDFAHALALANNTRFALTGGVYSRSPGHLARAQREFQVGNLYLNRGITGALVGRQPFGGFRMSGVGSKTGGPDYLLQFSEPRTITENTLRRGYAPSIATARRLMEEG